jgi:hypothetical protein
MYRNDQARKTKLLGIALVILLMLSCIIPSSDPGLQTEVANAGKTVVAEGKEFAATQLPPLKETAAAIAGTEIAQVAETAKAQLATQVITKIPGGANPEVQAARLLLKMMSAMQSPWKQVNAPLQNAPGERGANDYANVIDQFEVDSSDFAGRYVAGGSDLADTRCNIFAGDVMRAMGVPLPTKGNLGKGQGSDNATYTDPMTAQAVLLNDYLNKRIQWVTSAEDTGLESDWSEVDPTTADGLQALIEHVNAGKPALVSDAGHIAVVRPNQPAVTRWEDLIIAQAGASNFLSGTLEGHFFGTPQFFIHD